MCLVATGRMRSVVSWLYVRFRGFALVCFLSCAFLSKQMTDRPTDDHI